jgi:hypothetical protein
MSDLNTTDLIEVVGGSLRGLWLRLVDGKMLVVDIAENNELLDARTEVARWEKQPTVFIGVDPEKKGRDATIAGVGAIGGMVGAAMRTSSNLASARKRLAQLAAQPADINLVAAYPVDVCLARVWEEDTAVVRRGEAERYHIDRVSDKLIAEEFSSRWDFAIAAGARDKIYDDMRELPDGVEKCLLLNFVDGNSAVIADYSATLADSFNSECLRIEDDEFEVVQLIFRDPTGARIALQHDLDQLNVSAMSKGSSAIERLKLSQKNSDQRYKFEKLLRLCDLMNSGILSFNSARSRNAKLKLLSLSLDVGSSATGSSFSRDYQLERSDVEGLERGLDEAQRAEEIKNGEEKKSNSFSFSDLSTIQKVAVIGVGLLALFFLAR